MLMSWMVICTFLLFLTSAVYADRYKERTFKIEKTANIIYASNVPQLYKKHFVTSLATGLRTSPDAFPSLYFYQNANETTYEKLHFDLYQPINDTINSNHVKKIKSPILLVHGTNDNIIPFAKGKMLNLDSVRNKNRFMYGYASAASAFNINFSSPTFYGSFVIDSILEKNGVTHETYFVDGLGHEFYDREPYKTDVLKRIIEFLYKYMQ